MMISLKRSFEFRQFASFLAATLIVAVASAAPLYAQTKTKSQTKTLSNGHSQHLMKQMQMFEDRLMRLEQSVGALESMVGSGAQGAATFSSSATMGLERRIQRLEAALSNQNSSISGGSSSGASNAVRGQTAPTNLAPSRAAVSQNHQAGQPTANGTHSNLPNNPDMPVDTSGLAPLGGEKSGAMSPTGALVPKVGAVKGQQLYDEAYNALLGRNYSGAEQKFAQFVRENPKNVQVSNAQYWLGETHFMRGNYKEAATQFLQGYKLYKNSAKASDSLLKLAMSLQRLGKNQAACSTYVELTGRFKELPSYMNRRIAAERKRAGCS